MEKKDLYDLIEAYLDDALPDAKRREVEQRMEQDEDFRQEVELHRDLQEAYADPGRWHLRTVLQAVMEEPLPDAEPPKKKIRTTGQWRWWLALPAALLIGVAIWYFYRPGQYANHIDSAEKSPAATKPAAPPSINGQEVPPTPASTLPVLRPKTSDPAGKSPIIINLPDTLLPAKEQETPPTPATKPPAQKPKASQPIAMADPANFEENRSMEGLIAMRGDEDVTLTMTRPQIGERFQPNASGKTELRFAGAVEGLSAKDVTTLNLLVFDNKNVNTPILTRALQMTPDAKGAASFDAPVQVDAPKGLFYFRIENADGDILTAGKFSIGSLQDGSPRPLGAGGN